MMQIERLYEELGRALSERTRLEGLEHAAKESYQDTIKNAELVFREVSSDIGNQRQKMHERLEILQEAIRLVRDEGVDPVLAKLKANESLDERKQQSLVNSGSFTINSGVTISPYITGGGHTTATISTNVTGQSKFPYF